jgi:hypothetical protein
MSVSVSCRKPKGETAVTGQEQREDAVVDVWSFAILALMGALIIGTVVWVIAVVCHFETHAGATAGGVIGAVLGIRLGPSLVRLGK